MKEIIIFLTMLFTFISSMLYISFKHQDKKNYADCVNSFSGKLKEEDCYNIFYGE